MFYKKKCRHVVKFRALKTLYLVFKHKLFCNPVKDLVILFEGPKMNVNNRNQSEEIEFFTKLVYDKNSRYVVKF